MTSAITLEQAQAQLTAWLAASTATAGGQEFEISTGNGSRRLKRTDAAEIRQQINYWKGMVESLSAPGAGGRRRVRYVVPQQ